MSRDDVDMALWRADYVVLRDCFDLDRTPKWMSGIVIGGM